MHKNHLPSVGMSLRMVRRLRAFAIVELKRPVRPRPRPFDDVTIWFMTVIFEETLQQESWREIYEDLTKLGWKVSSAKLGITSNNGLVCCSMCTTREYGKVYRTSALRYGAELNLWMSVPYFFLLQSKHFIM